MRIKAIRSQSDVNFYDFDSDPKDWGLIERPFKCTCCCLARPEMMISIEGTQVGKVEEPFTFCDPVFHIYNTKGEERWKIYANCCQCGLICRNSCGRCEAVKFYIFDGNTSDLSPDNSSGTITKLFGGITELISDATNFHIDFPKNAMADEKLLIITTVLMIDFRLFEDSPGEGSQQ